MSLNIALALIAGFGPGQGPSMDTQIVAPIGNQVGVSVPQSAGQTTVTRSSESRYTQTTTDTSNSQKVTVSFRDVKASEILGWLEKHGVNFVISSDDVPDKKFSMNVEDMPADDVLDVMASALGGHWEQEHGIRVFRKGPTLFGIHNLSSAAPFRVYTTPPVPAAPDVTSVPPIPALPPIPAMPALPPMPAMPLFPKKADGKSMTPEEIQKYVGSKEFQEKMQAWSKQYAQKFDNKEFQERMEKWSKDVEKNFGPDFQKKMQDYAKQNEQKYKSFTFTTPDANVYQFNGDAAKLRDMARAQADAARAQADAARAQADAYRRSSDRYRAMTRSTNRKPTTTMSFDGLDVQQFMKNLTADQKDKQRKRGYILYSDLTPEQKKTLGGKPDGDFTISFDVNGDKLTIKKG